MDARRTTSETCAMRGGHQNASETPKSLSNAHYLCSQVKRQCLLSHETNENTKYHNFFQQFGVKYLYFAGTTDLFIDPSVRGSAALLKPTSQSVAFDSHRHWKACEAESSFDNFLIDGFQIKKGGPEPRFIWTIPSCRGDTSI